MLNQRCKVCQTYPELKVDHLGRGGSARANGIPRTLSRLHRATETLRRGQHHLIILRNTSRLRYIFNLKNGVDTRRARRWQIVPLCDSVNGILFYCPHSFSSLSNRRPVENSMPVEAAAVIYPI